MTHLNFPGRRWLAGLVLALGLAARVRLPFVFDPPKVATEKY